MHPGLSGRTGAEQIAQLAAQSVRWQQVHGAFFLAGVLALLGVLWLRQAVLPGGLRLVVDVFSIVGILGAVIFASTVLAEVIMIPDLSEACSASPGCLDPANAPFTEAFADAGWRVLPGLSIGARLLMAGVVALALIGWATDRLRILEAFPLVAGGGYELIDGTGLHGWGNFRLEDGATGLSAVLFLVGLGTMALRIRSEGRQTTEPDPEPEPVPSEG